MYSIRSFLSHVALAIFNYGVIEFALTVLAVVNVLAFVLYFVDKRRAVKGKFRISEKTLVIVTILFGGLGAVLAMVWCRHKTRKPKFKAAAIIGMAAFLVPVIHIAHSLTLDRVIRYVEVNFYAENWPEALNGYRIAFMADFHMIPHEDMAAVAAELNTRDIDLVLLGGDFTQRDDFYQGTLREIANIRATHGIFGVMGNHDHRIDLAQAKANHGMTLLRNEGVHIVDNFFVAGVDDLWWGEPDVVAATRQAGAEDFVLLISHNPDVAMGAGMSGVDLVLAGHTHGGQMTFFGYPIYLHRGSISQYGTRFARGFAYGAYDTPVFTTAGIGVYYNIPRVFNPPEVVIFTFYQRAG